MELDCVQRGSFPLYFGSYFMPLKASWLSMVSLLSWAAGDEGHACEFEGQELGEGSSRNNDLGGSWKFFLKVQMNGKEKCANLDWFYT